MEELIISETIAVRNRLSELGLDEDVLIKSALQGQAAWASWTPHHPPMYRGISAWAETVKALRDQLVLKGWQKSDPGNWSLVINPDETIALAVAAGNECTGDPLREPSTKSGKGPRTEEAIKINKLQLNLFPEMSVPDQAESAKARKTWWLLFSWDEESEELKCELSHPINIAEDGRIDGWAERIILSTTPLGGDDLVVGNDAGNDGPQGNVVEIDVEVKRRI